MEFNCLIFTNSVSQNLKFPSLVLSGTPYKSVTFFLHQKLLVSPKICFHIMITVSECDNVYDNVFHETKNARRLWKSSQVHCTDDNCHVRTADEHTAVGSQDVQTAGAKMDKFSIPIMIIARKRWWNVLDYNNSCNNSQLNNDEHLKKVFQKMYAHFSNFTHQNSFKSSV